MPDKFAVIFDMDGVIVDNYAFHQQAWSVFCANHGISWKDDFRSRIFGSTNKEHFRAFFGRELLDTEIDRYEIEKEQIYRELYRSHIKPVEGLEKFLEQVKEKLIPLALATSSPRVNVDFVLSQTGLRGYFPLILDATSVIHGKPDPEVYLKTAKMLHFETSLCIVIEDSIPGIKAAKAAGMRVIGISTSLKKDELTEADLIIEDFNELNLRVLENLT